MERRPPQYRGGYCKFWVHTGHCHNKDCTFKHEMPIDDFNIPKLPLHDGIPDWYKQKAQFSPTPARTFPRDWYSGSWRPQSSAEVFHPAAESSSPLQTRAHSAALQRIRRRLDSDDDLMSKDKNIQQTAENWRRGERSGEGPGDLNRQVESPRFRPPPGFSLHDATARDIFRSSNPVPSLESLGIRDGNRPSLTNNSENATPQSTSDNQSGKADATTPQNILEWIIGQVNSTFPCSIIHC